MNTNERPLDYSGCYMTAGIIAGVAFWAVVAAWGFWGWLGMVAAGVAAAMLWPIGGRANG